MKRMYLTALVAVFLSLTLAGCYTKLKGPVPATGVEQNYYRDYPNYYDDYYNPLYFQYGWYNPYYFGSPSYFGNFYYPWWYDPYYYDGGYYPGGTVPVNPGGKDIRRRRGGDRGTFPSVPSGGYSAPAQPSSPSGQSTEPASSNPSKPSGNTGSSGEKDNSSGGKTTRGRR